MALGGGNFLSQNKVLPGSYINFVSAARASVSLSDRGVAAMPVTLDWGPMGDVIELTDEDFRKNSLYILGYDYASPRLKGLRDLFKNVRKAYLYVMSGSGAKAGNEYAEARYEGLRGNDLSVAIYENPDDPTMLDVTLYIEGVRVDRQTVKNAADLIDNAFVIWKPDAALVPTVNTPLTGGVTPSMANSEYQSFLDKIENYSFNAMGCPSYNQDTMGLFAEFTKRMRDEQGAKFQCVLFGYAADYEGVVNVLNCAVGYGLSGEEVVYWVTGVVAGTEVNRSALNKVYDGEYDLNVNFTQTQLEAAIHDGKFAFHRVGSDIRVLSDVTSLVTVTDEKGEAFKENQTIRVLDQIANDIAAVFNTKYLGVVPNDASGRISLWSDIVRQHEELQRVRAIEGFSSSDITVEQGDIKRSVVVSSAVTPVNAMAQLYMTCIVA